MVVAVVEGYGTHQNWLDIFVAMAITRSTVPFRIQLHSIPSSERPCAFAFYS